MNWPREEVDAVVRAVTPTAAASEALVKGFRYGSVTLAPLGTGADDWPRRAAVLAVSAGKWPVYLAAGSGALSDWYCKSEQVIPSDSEIHYMPGAKVLCTLAGGVETSCPEYAGYTLAGAGDTTLAAANLPGLSVVETPAAVAVGAKICLVDLTGGIDKRSIYDVIACTQEIVETGDALAQLSAWVLSGVTTTHSTAGALFAKVSVPAGNATVQLYKELGMTTLVAYGALAGNGGGTITLVANGGSGVTGTVDIIPAAAASTDTVVTCDLLALLHNGGRVIELPALYANRYAVHTERPVRFQYASADSVLVVASQPHDITIEGGVYTGQAWNYLNFVGAKDVIVRDCRMDGSSGTFSTWSCIAFNLACYNCRSEGCEIEGLGGFVMNHWAMTCQSAEGCSHEHFAIRRTPDNVVVFRDSIGCYVRDGRVENCDSCGWAVNGSDTTLGCIDCWCDGFDGADCDSGIDIRTGSADIRVSNATILRCRMGIALQSGCVRPRLDKCVVNYNGVYGLFVNDALDLIASDIVANYNAQYGVVLRRSAALRGLSCKGNGAGHLELDVNTCNVTIDGFTFEADGITSFGVVHAVAGTLRLLNGSFLDIINGGYGIYNLDVGTVVRENVVLGGVGGSVGYKALDANNTLIDHAGVDDSGCATALSLATAACHVNHGTLTLNGVAPITVACRAVRADSDVVLTMKTPVGTLASPFVDSKTAGTGFTARSQALDTSTLNWRVTDV